MEEKKDYSLPHNRPSELSERDLQDVSGGYAYICNACLWFDSANVKCKGGAEGIVCPFQNLFN